MESTLVQGEAITQARGSCPDGKIGGMKIKVRLEAFEPCPLHAPTPCDCPKVSIGVREKEHDLATTQFAKLVQALILNSTQTITDITSTGRSIANASATTTPTIAAGTTGTAATVADVALGASTETVAATVNATSGAGSTCTFTVTGTITAGADRAYTEVGLTVVNAAHTFLICRDTFSVLNVSNTGTLAVTYSLSFS